MATVKYKKGWNPSEFIASLEQSRTVEPNGNVRFQGTGSLLYETLLFDCFEFSEKIPPSVAFRLFRETLFSSEVELRQDVLLRELSKGANRYLNSDSTRYVVFTRLSVSMSNKLRNIRVSNTDLRFGTPPWKYVTEAEPWRRHAKAALGIKYLADSYMPVRIFVTAKSIDEAYDLAFDHFDLVRAVWNFTLNLRRVRHRFGVVRPQNRLMTGLVHTIHNTKGKLASDTYKYDLFPVIDVTDVSSSYDAMCSNWSLFKKRLFDSPYAPELRLAMLRYVRALDEMDPTIAFHKLWIILEQLTGSRTSQNNQLERAAFLSPNYEHILKILKQLKRYRNDVVHQEVNPSLAIDYCNLLRNIVESHLVFQLRNNFGFQTLGESIEFLSVPVRSIELVRKALNYRDSLK